MEAEHAGSLVSFLATVPDPRSRHGRQHRLSAILALVYCAIMCCAKSYTAIAQWAKDLDIGLMHRLRFIRRTPKMGEICKILIALDPKAVEDVRVVKIIDNGLIKRIDTRLHARFLRKDRSPSADGERNGPHPIVSSSVSNHQARANIASQLERLQQRA